MNQWLDSNNFPSGSNGNSENLSESLCNITAQDGKEGMMSQLAKYAEVLSDNKKRDQWDDIHNKLTVLFKCGKYKPLDGPMIGIALSNRDTDYFKKTAELFGKQRSAIANIQWMATCWNATYGNTGMWMGKTFESISKSEFSVRCGNHPAAMNVFKSETSRIGRNFFRHPHNPSLIQMIGLPALTKLWDLKDRPDMTNSYGLPGKITNKNLEHEKVIPYQKTGGFFLANQGCSALSELNHKKVYQLNYRWPELNPVYPMTRLVDELVQIDKGIYLGQLIMASKNYSLGKLKLTFLPGDKELTLGEAYNPDRPLDGFRKWFNKLFRIKNNVVDYGYQNNGYFLMISPERAAELYEKPVFSYLKPHPGEVGYKELGYDKTADDKSSISSSHSESIPQHTDQWVDGWRKDERLANKFTTFCLEDSPKQEETEDITALRKSDESILQMIHRFQKEISAQTKYDDHMAHFEKLNRLFRRGVAPEIKNGCFQGRGRGFNTRFNSPNTPDWYGQEEPCLNFDYYHGATLNLHWGFADNFRPELNKDFSPWDVFPSSLISPLQNGSGSPNLLNTFWASIGRFIFPWAGKSFETISGRKLSMLLDESGDLRKRYPDRVSELKRFPASWPHYNLVKLNENNHWNNPSQFAEYLSSGSWDNGMDDGSKAFWEEEASSHWVFGNNIQDSRIISSDAVMKILDMNYKVPDQSLRELAESGPSPFARQGYIFMGTSDRESILPMNNGPDQKKKVFQFHYRYPMIGGPAPIGTCLDELVEIAEGLFLGQLIYSTVPWVPYHSSEDPSKYKYQLFGYFMLMDNEWEHHRQAIGLDVLH